MWIKICANTNAEDALLAAQLGADAVGFVFAPSKRQVTVEQVAAITVLLPPEIEKIGVFTTSNASEIAATVYAAGLTGVQLHSAFNIALIHSLRRDPGPDTSIIQTVHWAVDQEGDNAEALVSMLKSLDREPAVDRVLIDSRSTKGTGGTGVSFDWSGARESLKGFQGRLIVAGGLHPGNVAQAIHTLAPWGVDVASGVEAMPGKKEPARLRAFMTTAR